jgi:hypothetical protein
MKPTKGVGLLVTLYVGVKAEVVQEDAPQGKCVRGLV